MPEHQAPPVVAVVVAFDPGPWLEECLASLRDQDYASCSVLVFDAASNEPLAARVAAVAPGAYLQRLSENHGFGPSANAVLTTVENAAFYLFCHDDVVLAPDVVRKMVEEAFRSNAGIVTPKLLDVEDEGRLLQLGLAVDRLGTPMRRVERFELDQSQHDEVREVFAAPGGCTLVRADLFAAVGGFDPAISFFGEDVDLCWRARLAGARVMVAPSAEVLHLEATATRRRSRPETRSLRRRHELRAVLKNYRGWRRQVATAQLALLTVIECAYYLILGRRERVRELVGAWRWNLAAEQGLKAARASVAESRRVPDRVVAKLFSHRRSRLWYLVRTQLEQRLGWAGSFERSGPRIVPIENVAPRPLPGARLADDPFGRRPPWRRPAGAMRQPSHHAHQEHRPAFVVPLALVVAFVLFVGARSILAGPTPLIGQLAPIPSPTSLLGHFLGGWTDGGLQRPGPASPAFAALGLAGGVLFGSRGLLLVVELVVCVAAGAFGMARLLRPLAPPAARLAGAVAYLFLPLAVDDLARGDVEALVAYAAMPFVLARLARASRVGAYATGAESRSPWWRECLALGALLGFAGSFAPAIVPLALAVTVLVAAAGVLTSEGRRSGRILAIGAGGVVVAFVLCLPWSITFLQPGARLSALLGASTLPSRAPSLSELMRFADGPTGHGLLGWAFLVAASFVLLVGRRERLAWAARWWMVFLGTVALAWAAAEGWLGAGGGELALLLAPGAAAIAACVGLGIASLAFDLPRARFGWRHGIGIACGACAVAGLFPVLGASLGGRYGMPSTGYDSVLSWTGRQTAGRPGTSVARVLWLGDPTALPLPGWQLRPGLALAVSSGGLPDAGRLYPSANPGVATTLIADVRAAEAGQTIVLGSMLASDEIQAIVVPTATAPVLNSVQTAQAAPPPEQLLAGLAAQSDLHELPPEAGALVFENTAWRPGAIAPPIVLTPGGTPAVLRGIGVGAEILSWVVVGVLLASRRFRRRPPPSRSAAAATAPPPGERPSEDEPLPVLAGRGAGTST